MKKSLFRITLITAMLSLFTFITHATLPGSLESSNNEEGRLHLLFPDLPEDFDILYGDANDDGVINILDIISMVNYITGGNPDPFNFEAADVNDDGVIDVLDIIFEVNIILAVPGMHCPGILTVTYEGQMYNTLLIGGQCWLKENMNAGEMINGVDNQSNNTTIEKYCYNDDPANCETYGGLYQWDEAIQYTAEEAVQGICPLGWHLPSDNEWQMLEGAVDTQFPVGDPIWDNDWWRGLDAGGNLKEEGIIHWESPNSGATNASGFTALPGGVRNNLDGLFNEMALAAYFWSSSVLQSDFATIRFLDYQHSSILRYSYAYKQSGYSVRCIKGCVPQPSQANAGPDQLNLIGSSATLAGNTPTSGTGEWEIVGGTGGLFDDPSDPGTVFHGLPGNAYSLSWTISTVCGSSSDTVLISFVAFTCGNPLIDIRDGKSYATVQIGTQCWMAENLNVGTKINSTSDGYQQTDNGIIEKYCYGNDLAQCNIYGALYEWPEAMQYVTTEGAQGLCPSGWYIPSDNDLKILTGTVDSQYPVGDPEWDHLGRCGLDAGGNLKETGITHWNPPNAGATNVSGFTGLPGGYRNIYNGGFDDIGSLGSFWSSSQGDPEMAWSRYLDYSDPRISHFLCTKENGFSIRCLKDNN